MPNTNYKLCKKTIGEDTWLIHYRRWSKTTIKITCDLLRPNRKFWQSKFLWSDWTFCTAEEVNLLEDFADAIIYNYYHQKEVKEKFDNFFENTD